MFLNIQDLPHIRQRHGNERIVLVGGCYDLLHLGHMTFLEECRKLGDILVVVASSDIRVRERKGRARPILGQEMRAMMLAELSCVSYALVAPDPDPGLPPPTVRVINILKPDIFATTDSRFESFIHGLQLRGVRTVLLQPTNLITTTDIINRIRSRYHSVPQ